MIDSLVTELCHSLMVLLGFAVAFSSFSPPLFLFRLACLAAGLEVNIKLYCVSITTRVAKLDGNKK